MRAIPGILLVLALTIAGCAGPEDGSDGANETDDGTDGTDGGQDGEPITSSPSPSPERPPPPKEQRVDDPDDVDQPGEYAILPRAEDHEDERWNVPAWTVGDRWLYEHQVFAPPAPAPVASVQVEDRVSGTGTVQEVDTYRITRTERDCKGDDSDCVRRLNFTQADLVEIEDNGYIEHTFVFPLEDGKRWIFASSDGSGDVNRIRAEARHDADYTWPGTIKRVEAWNIVLTYEDEPDVEQRYWLGEDQKNVLRREIWSNQEGSWQMVFSTTLKSYTPA